MGFRIPLIRPVFAEEEIQEIRATLASGFLTEGPRVRQFEREFAQIVGSGHGVATTSCTMALVLALQAAGLRPGDEVLVPALTHPATGLAVQFLGGIPVLVDVEEASRNIDWEAATAWVTPRTRGVVPVSLFGHPLNPSAMRDFASRHGLWTVEDAACSAGAAWGNVRTGAMADLTCFSFHPRKLVAIGEGGMVTTDNAQSASLLRSAKNFGIEQVGGVARFSRPGVNLLMSDLQGAVGLCQLRRFDGLVKDRRSRAARYSKVLAGRDGIAIPEVPPGALHTYQTYTVLLRTGVRDRVRDELRSKGIEAQIGTYAIHLEPVFAGTPGRDCPVTERLANDLLALPLYAGMTDAEQDEVVGALQSSIAGAF